MLNMLKKREENSVAIRRKTRVMQTDGRPSRLDQKKKKKDSRAGCVIHNGL